MSKKLVIVVKKHGPTESYEPVENFKVADYLVYIDGKTFKQEEIEQLIVRNLE